MVARPIDDTLLGGGWADSGPAELAFMSLLADVGYVIRRCDNRPPTGYHLVYQSSRDGLLTWPVELKHGIKNDCSCFVPIPNRSTVRIIVGNPMEWMACRVDGASPVEMAGVALSAGPW